MFFGLAILCLATVPPALCEKIHERMTLNEVAQIFQKTHHSLVPEYEVVQFQMSRRNRRDSASPQLLMVSAFGDNMGVELQPSNLATKNTPVLEARSDRNGKVFYEPLRNAMSNVGKIYEDPQQRASLVIETDSKGQYLINGFIGSKNLVVRSLPESISYDLMQNNSLYDSELSQKSRTTRSAYHVVFRAEEKYSEESAKMFGLNDQSPIFQVHNYASEMNSNGVLFPEIMVVLDHKFYELHGKNVRKALTYVLAFWNGVDLVYRKFTNPKFRFNIARIIISKDFYATPYMINNLLKDGYISGDKAWDDTRLFYFNKLDIFKNNSYDAVITMTGHGMGNGSGIPFILGIATLGGMCDIRYDYKRVLSTGITTDDGRFGHIITAAHEFAHLLNVAHDGADGNKCDGEAGYIMSPTNKITGQHFQFSRCSVDQMSRFLSTGMAKCMSNTPKKGNAVPKFLPGEIIDRDHQCQSLGHHQGSCYQGPEKHSPCFATYCISADKQYCTKTYPIVLPDGTLCDSGKICLQGNCVGRKGLE